MSDSPVERITLRSIFESILGVLNLERGIFYTIRELALRPGEAIQHYLYTEKRRLFIKPLSFLLLVTAVVVFLSTRVVASMVDMSDLTKNFPAGLSAYWKEVLSITFVKSQEYSNALQLASVPLLAICTFFIFRKKAFNFAEHLVINAYVIGFQGLLGLLTLLAIGFDDSLAVLLGLLGLGYFLYAMIQIFALDSLAGILKIVAVIILGEFLKLAFTILAFAIYFWFYPV